MVANMWMALCFMENDLQWCAEFSVYGVCFCLGFWSVFFFVLSAVLTFTAEASMSILITYRWTKMVVNAIRISYFMKNVLRWLTGACCCLGYWSAFSFAPSAFWLLLSKHPCPFLLQIVGQRWLPTCCGPHVS